MKMRSIYVKLVTFDFRCLMLNLIKILPKLTQANSLLNILPSLIVALIHDMINATDVVERHQIHRIGKLHTAFIWPYAE